jgi:hypothetical protein
MIIHIMLHLWHGYILYDHTNNLILKLFIRFITHFSRCDGALRDHLGVLEVMLLLALCKDRPLVKEGGGTSQRGTLLVVEVGVVWGLV